ncbi:AAA family ATPase [soil metagenome]
MKLILIYGSPAVGKLTTANEIAKMTGFRVFHNHLTITAVTPVFEFGTAPFWKLVNLFRIETIAEAVCENVNLIYTFCYAKTEDDAHIAEVTKVVEENGGEICFVLLVAEKSVIQKRVLEESRKKHGKIASLDGLQSIWEKYELFSPVPESVSLIIDNSNLSAQTVARRISKHFNLEKTKD